MEITGVNAERKVIDRKKKESVRGGYCYYTHDNYFPKDNNIDISKDYCAVAESRIRKVKESERLWW